MKLKPLQDRVIVRQSEAEEKTRSGIILPDAAKEKPTKGKVIAVDVQAPMMAALRKRARKQGLEERIVSHVCEADSLGIQEPVDFALAFWMIHEVPNQSKLFCEIRLLLKPKGRLLLAEPVFHVTRRMFEETLKRAGEAGFTSMEKPRIFLSRTALLSLRGG